MIHEFNLISHKILAFDELLNIHNSVKKVGLMTYQVYSTDFIVMVNPVIEKPYLFPP